MGFKVYDSNQVKISIVGIPITGGFADGEFLRLERETEAFTDVVGTDGEVTRSKTNDNRATVTILLMQTSSDNQLLSALHNTDKSQNGGAGVGRFLVEDLNGQTLHEGPNCWIMTDPDASYDREATAREWQIRVANLTGLIAGT
jgi:hypothetical protein